MIILQEKHDDVNIIHLITGPESQFQLDMAGHIMVDVSGTVDPNAKNFIVLNRCTSEEALQEKLTEIQKRMRMDDHENQSINGHIQKTVVNKVVKCPKCKSQNVEVKNGKGSLCESCQKIEKGLNSSKNQEFLKMSIDDRLRVIKELTKDDKEFKAIIKKHFIDKVKKEIKHEQ